MQDFVNFVMISLNVKILYFEDDISLINSMFVMSKFSAHGKIVLED